MEIEIKRKFSSKDDFEKFKEHMFKISTHHHTQVQTNHFFTDTDGYFNANKIALRLREINNNGKIEYKITIKGKHTIIDGVSSQQERETDISSEFFTAAMESPNKILDLDWPYGFEMIEGVENLIYVGHFMTIRSCVNIEEIPELFEIDETHFPETVEYELEVETERSAEIIPIINRIAKDINIQVTSATQSKFKTFLMQINQ